MIKRLIVSTLLILLLYSGCSFAKFFGPNSFPGNFFSNGISSPVGWTEAPIAYFPFTSDATDLVSGETFNFVGTPTFTALGMDFDADTGSNAAFLDNGKFSLASGVDSWTILVVFNPNAIVVNNFISSIGNGTIAFNQISMNQQIDAAGGRTNHATANTSSQSILQVSGSTMTVGQADIHVMSYRRDGTTDINEVRSLVWNSLADTEAFASSSTMKEFERDVNHELRLSPAVGRGHDGVYRNLIIVPEYADTQEKLRALVDFVFENPGVVWDANP